MSLAAIQTKSKAKPSIVIIYGPSGLGKTTLAVGSKNPIVLQTEEGLGILMLENGVGFVPTNQNVITTKI